MELKQNSSRCVILLHEIYGINQHIQDYAQLFFERGYDVYVPNLVNRKGPFTYKEEAKAYSNFMDNVGFSKAKLQVIELITEVAPKYEHIRLVGFSIGATIAWLCSESTAIHKVVGFYGSRIRQYTNIKPAAPTILIYGKQEQSFNPIDLKEALTLHKHVEIKIVDGVHGFADRYSMNYNSVLTKGIVEYILLT